MGRIRNVLGREVKVHAKRPMNPQHAPERLRHAVGRRIPTAFVEDYDQVPDRQDGREEILRAVSFHGGKRAPNGLDERLGFGVVGKIRKRRGSPGVQRQQSYAAFMRPQGCPAD